MSADRFPAAQAAIDGLSEEDRRIVLLRLAAKLNNGDEHFDHNDPDGYSWLCHRCAAEGRGGLNGWAGVAHLLASKHPITSAHHETPVSDSVQGQARS